MAFPAAKLIGEASGTHPQMGQSAIRVMHYDVTNEAVRYTVELTVGGQTKSLDMTPEKAVENLEKFRALCGC